MTKLKFILLVSMLLVGSANAADQGRKIVYHEDPEYPALAGKMNLHGNVKLKIWISPDGTVRRLEYIGGHPVLAESSLKAVKLWRYQPDTQESTAIVELKF
ncbi:MAG: energy transducer TonB [Terriglobales bacterium]|jgi:TonB family protein